MNAIFSIPTAATAYAARLAGLALTGDSGSPAFTTNDNGDGTTTLTVTGDNLQTPTQAVIDALVADIVATLRDDTVEQVKSLFADRMTVICGDIYQQLNAQRNYPVLVERQQSQTLTAYEQESLDLFTARAPLAEQTQQLHTAIKLALRNAVSLDELAQIDITAGTVTGTLTAHQTLIDIVDPTTEQAADLVLFNLLAASTGWPPLPTQE